MATTKMSEADKLYMLAADALLFGPETDTVAVARARLLRRVKAVDMEALTALVMERRKLYAVPAEDTPAAEG